jgi:hypothetical protein
MKLMELIRRIYNKYTENASSMTSVINSVTINMEQIECKIYVLLGYS